MDFTTLALVILGLLFLAAAGFAIHWRSQNQLVESKRQQLANDLAKSEAHGADLAAQLDATRIALNESEKKLTALVAASTAELKAERERVAAQEARAQKYLEDLEKLRATMKTEFEAVAAKLLDEKSKKFTEHNRQQVDGLLQPLRQQLTDFRERVDHVHKDDVADRASLKTQLEQLRQLNSRITDEAQQLTRALKGQAQARGAWGELVLERLLQSSGLRAGEDYSTQESFTNEDGSRLRPDVIVRLPDQRHLVIDSKVSLIAYEQAVSANEPEARSAALKSHAAAVRRHVEELAGKQYEELGQLNSPDYVMMFVPLEPAFTAALESDPELYEWAFARRVVLCTAPTLLVTLKTVAMLWTQDRQSKNVQAIAERGGALHDKFVGLLADLEGIGQQLQRTRDGYNAAMNKLKDGRGNLIKQVADLKKLGAKAKKTLPAADDEEVG